MMELSSLWGPKYYDDYCLAIQQAFQKTGSSIRRPGSWREVNRAVSARTTGNFPLVAEGSTHESLTTLHTDRPLKVDGLKSIDNSKCTMNQPEMSLAYGLDGNVFRDTI